METTNYVLAYPDGDSLLLFNPYHDERGRFTSKERAIFIGGQPTAVRKIGERETEDGIEALFSGDHYTGAITVPGSMGKEDIKNVQETVAVAMDSMKAVGIRGIGQHVKFYDDVGKYARAIDSETTVSEELPGGIVDFDNIAHIHPRELGAIIDYSKFRATREDAIESIGMVIHELYHGRKEGGGWQGRDFPRWIEEGLASFAEDISKTGLLTGDFRLKTMNAVDTLRDYMRYRHDIDVYGREIDMIRSAAAEKASHTGTVWTNILAWVQSGSKVVGRDIAKWYAEFEKSYRHENIGDVISLYNPYHDERGRFTSKERAVSISSLAHPPDKVTKRSGDGYTEALFSGWDTSVMIVGPNLDPNDPAIVGTQTAIAAASDALNKIGVPGYPSLVIGHTSDETFKAAFRRMTSGESVDPSITSGFADHIKKRIHLSPKVVSDLRDVFSGLKPRSSFGVDLSKAIEVIGHELFHLRHGSEETESGPLEEGLTTIAGILCSAYQSVGDFSLKNPRTLEFFNDRINKQVYLYRLAASTVVEAAQKFEKDPRVTGSWEQIILRWLKRPADESYPQIKENVNEWTKAFFGKHLEWDDDIVSLYNPYHDEKGRFTTAERAVSVVKYNGFGPEEEKEHRGTVEEFVNSIPHADIEKIEASKDADGVVTLFFDGKYQIIDHMDVVYNTDERAEISAGVGLGQKALHKIGIFNRPGVIPAVHLYDNFDDFAEAYGIPPPGQNYPWAFQSGGDTYFSPSCIRRILSDMRSIRRTEELPIGYKDKTSRIIQRLQGIGTVAHELYHAWLYHKGGNYSPLGKAINEGITDMVDCLAKTGLLTGDFRLETDRARTIFNIYINENNSYKPYRQLVRYYLQQKGGEWHKEFLHLARSAYTAGVKKSVESINYPDWILRFLKDKEKTPFLKASAPDTDTVLLFNPYHDERGRFTTSEQAVSISGSGAEQLEKYTRHIKNPPSKIETSITENSVVTLFSGNDWHTEVEIITDQPLEYDQAIGGIQVAAAVAVQGLKNLKVPGIYAKIVGHTLPATFIEKFKELHHDIELPEDATAFADPKNLVLHLSSEAVQRTMDIFRTSGAIATGALLSSTEIIAHELFHLRQGKEKVEGSGVEEGLATIAGIVSAVGSRLGSYSLKDSQFFETCSDIWSQNPYKDYVETVINVAAYKSGDNYASTIHKWLSDNAVDSRNEIFALIDKIMKEHPEWERIDEEAVLLYNPYHDERGRFTSAEHAVLITKVKEIEDNSVALFSGKNYTGSVTVPGSLDKEDIKTLHTATALAVDYLNELGIRDISKHIKYYNDRDKFEEAYHVTSGLPFEWAPGGFLDKVTKIAHLGPEYVERLTTAIYDRTTSDYKIDAVGTIAHELYHGRNRDKGIKKEIEEGLATLVQAFVQVGTSEHREDWKELGDWRDENKFFDYITRHSYEQYATRIINAAEAFEREHDVYWVSKITDWIKSGNIAAQDEIEDYYYNHWMQFEDIHDSVLLYNPYHDVAGRFTEQQHAVKPLPEDKLHVHGKADQKAAFRVADATSLAYEKMGAKPVDVHMYDNMDEYIRQSCNKASDKKDCTTRAANSYGCYVNGSILISPIGAKAIAANRAFGEKLIAHEAYHSRKRKGGKLGPTFGSKPGDKFANYTKKDLEEGATDLLSTRGVGGKITYPAQMGAIALMAGQISGWDQKKAWSIIDDLHYNINDWKYIGKLMTDFTGGEPKGGWTPQTMYALLAELQKASAQNNYQAVNWVLQERR